MLVVEDGAVELERRARAERQIGVLSAITKRAALPAPVRTVSSRSMLSPTLIGVVVAATRTTSF
ncbi:hypothetical protein ACVWZ6_003454 [Bradyrhizobium sp. GM6.1]